jgi:hypothetical protein
MFLPLFSLFWSCTDATVIGTEKIGESDTNSEEEEVALEWTLTVELEAEGIVGAQIPYTVMLTEAQGTVAEDLAWTVTSDTEAISYTKEFIVPSVAGQQTLTFTTEHDGVSYSADVILSLSPSEIDIIDLVLSDHVFYAGEEITYDVIAYDEFGNEVDTATVIMDLQGPDLNDSSMGSEKITSTTPGLYTVAASLGDIQDIELVQVFAGPTVSLTLDVPSENVELSDTLACSVITLDEFGNETTDPWTLTTVGGTSDILYNNIIFLEEDIYEIRAELDSDTSIFDTFGPFMVDSFGPLLTVTSPERAEWNTSYTGTVTGNVYDYPAGLDLLTIDANVQTPDTSGNFSLPTTYTYGTNFIETYALDLDGNDSKDIRAVLSGAFQPKDLRFEDGILIYLGDNNDGIGALESYAEGYIDNMDISSMLPTGNIVDEYDCVVDTWFGCALSYTIRLRLNGASYDSASIDMSTNSNGTVQANATINNITIGWVVSGTVDTSGNVTANNATVNMVLTPSVSNDQLYINLDSVQSSFSNLDFNVSGTLGSIIDFFGLDSYIENEMESYAEEAIRDVVTDEIPPVLEDVLSDFSIEEQFTVMDTTYSLSSVPSDVYVDNDGLTLSMTSNLVGDTWIQPADGLGSLMSSISAPSWSNSTGLGINLSLNVVNQLLYQAWGGGILALDLDTASLGIESEDLEFVFPNATDLRITVDALLPPVTVEDSSGDLELQAGDVYIAIHNGELSAGDVRLELYVHLTAPMEISVVNNTVTPSIGEPSFTFNVVYPDSGGSSANSTESLLGALIPYIMPSLENAISGIELPQLGDFTFQNMTSGVSDNHLNASATLQAN